MEDDVTSPPYSTDVLLSKLSDPKVNLLFFVVVLQTDSLLSVQTHVFCLTLSFSVGLEPLWRSFIQYLAGVSRRAAP